MRLDIVIKVQREKGDMLMPDHHNRSDCIHERERLTNFRDSEIQ